MRDNLSVKLEGCYSSTAESGLTAIDEIVDLLNTHSPTFLLSHDGLLLLSPVIYVKCILGITCG